MTKILTQHFDEPKLHEQSECDARLGLFLWHDHERAFVERKRRSDALACDLYIFWLALYPDPAPP